MKKFIVISALLGGIGLSYGVERSLEGIIGTGSNQVIVEFEALSENNKSAYCQRVINANQNKAPADKLAAIDSIFSVKRINGFNTLYQICKTQFPDMVPQNQNNAAQEKENGTKVKDLVNQFQEQKQTEDKIMQQGSNENVKEKIKIFEPQFNFDNFDQKSRYLKAQEEALAAHLKQLQQDQKNQQDREKAEAFQRRLQQANETVKKAKEYFDSMNLVVSLLRGDIKEQGASEFKKRLSDQGIDTENNPDVQSNEAFLTALTPQIVTQELYLLGGQNAEGQINGARTALQEAKNALEAAQTQLNQIQEEMEQG